MKNICLFVFLICCNVAYGQTEISGKVYDSNNQAVANVSVQLKNKADKVIGFALTKKDGSFKINTQNTTDSLKLIIKSINYKFFEKQFLKGNHSIDIKLEEQIQSLQEVKIVAPIVQKGDTISFNVGKFATARDQSIADVLKKMPGIEVASDGTIKHNGKEINKFYVEGLDPVSGRYGTISENLGHNKVERVELLQNHQPIKSLEGKEFSENSAINLKLKKEWTINHKVELGLGAAPFLYDANYNPMVFNKKKQFVNNFQANNVGLPLQNRNRVLATNELMNRDGQLRLATWANIQRVSSPVIPVRYWLNNDSKMASVNSVIKSKKHWQNRLNTNVNFERNNQIGQTINTILKPSQNVFFTEKNEFMTNFRHLDIDWHLEQNVVKSFKKNVLKFNKNWNDNLGEISIENKKINQQLEATSVSFSNSFDHLITGFNKVKKINSFVGYGQSPQVFDLNQDYFGISTNPNLVIQNTLQKKWMFNHGLSFTKYIKTIFWEANINVDNEKNSLFSNINPLENSKINDFNNNLDWIRWKAKAAIVFGINNDYFKLNINNPFSQINIANRDLQTQKTASLSKILYEPSIGANWLPNAFWKVSANISKSNNFGTMEQQYYGYLFKNYRQLNRFNNIIQETENRHGGLRLAYQNVMNGWVWNLNFGITQNNNNVIEKSAVDKKGFENIEFIEQYNTRRVKNINSYLSKSFLKQKTVLSIENSFSSMKSPRILNDIVQTIANNVFNINPKVNFNALEWLNLEYDFKASWTENNAGNKSNAINAKSYLHSLQLYGIVKDKSLVFDGDYVSNTLGTNNNSYLLGNIRFLQRFGKNKKYQANLSVNNIFNTSLYQNFNINNLRVLESQMNLRPRQFMIKIVTIL